MVTTGADGTFSFTHELGYSISRGEHLVSVNFYGEELYLSDSTNTTVFSRADINVEILLISDEVVRSDETRPIRVRGRVLEIGGDGNTMEEMEMALLWEGSLSRMQLFHGTKPQTVLITSNAKTYASW